MHIEKLQSSAPQAKYFQAFKLGKEKLFKTNGTVLGTQLNDVAWETRSYMFNAIYRFK